MVGRAPPPHVRSMRLSARRFCASSDARLRRSAASAFTDWHASDLGSRLLLKCKEPTTNNKLLLRAADLFTLQHADVQQCRIGEVIAEMTHKTFLTPVGQLHFEWKCCHSQMPMELPLRWNLQLLLRPTAERMTLADPEWNDSNFSVLVAGEMLPDARGPPRTLCKDASGLSSLMKAVENAGDSPLPRSEATWLLSFLCGEPSDFAFDSLSGTLEVHADELL
jgi:hypothetical protein